jgi:ABC-type transporter Mla subunit MlaD
MAGVADKNALKAGFFMVTALALGLTVFFLVKGYGFTGRQSWTIRFDVDADVGGVGPGSEVRVGGVDVGEVQSVQISEDLKYVDVGIALPDGIQLRQEPRVVIQATVTGVAWLNFEDLGQGEPLARGTIIRGNAGTIANLVAAANRLAPSLTGLVDDVRQQTVPAVNEVLSKSSRTIDNMDATVQRFGDAADRVGGAAESAAEVLQRNRENLDTILANLRDASERAPRVLEDANVLVSRWTDTADSLRSTLDSTSEQLNGLIADTREIAGDVREVGRDARESAREVRGIISGNRGKIETIINRLRETSTTMSLAASEIRRSPWRLLYKPTGEQRESLDLYDAARRFAEGASALQDAAVALNDASRDPTSDPEQVRQLLEALQKRFSEFEQIERLLYERLRD